ncbi:MAG: membrane protein insertase YidC, partial [Calditrichaeota bacterium]
VDWTAIRIKYFLVSIIPSAPEKVQSATLEGVGIKYDGVLTKNYSTSLELPYVHDPVYTDSFTVYLGPLDYKILKSYQVGLEDLVMNKDWYEGFFLFRAINIYFILPAFNLLHKLIPNYGFVIIIFSILIKILLHPLTKKSYQSMSEMQYLQPKMAELREKYKDDPQRLNREMMRLYKEHGVNPLGGCLPTLLQMPLLFALFIVFRSTIQLRGAPFILWITDLSSPDKLHLGFSLPFIGDTIHILPLLMGLTMVWQSKMTMTDPKQKFMIYFMPIFLIFIFYNLPSGLNLYYAVFNLLSMFQTRYIKKKMHPDNGDGRVKLGDDHKKAAPAPVTKKPVSPPSPRRKKKKRKKHF